MKKQTTISVLRALLLLIGTAALPIQVQAQTFCERFCQFGAAAIVTECFASGGDIEECTRRGDDAFTFCMENLCGIDLPNAVTLTSFTAQASTDGSVTLTWVTATEIDNIGFNLYRATAARGPYIKINSALITAQGDPVAGASYSFQDSPGPGTFRYILTDVDAFAEITLHGPVRVKGAAAGQR